MVKLPLVGHLKQSLVIFLGLWRRRIQIGGRRKKKDGQETSLLNIWDASLRSRFRHFDLQLVGKLGKFLSH